MILSKHISDYLDFLKHTQHSSPSTLKSYTHYLEVFKKFATPQISPEHITPELITSYKTFLTKYEDPLSQKPIKEQTQTYFLIALRSFLRFLTERGVRTIDSESIQLNSLKHNAPEVISSELVEKLIHLPDPTTREGIRDRAILSLFATIGLFVSQLVKLNREDVKLKEGKLGVYLLEEPSKQLLKNYLSVRDDTFKPLFIRYKGEVSIEDQGEKMRLSERSIERMAEKYSKRLGEKVTPLILRHSFATTQLTQGEELEELQKKLGHKNIVSTKVYERNL